jgi:hypothetical protein
MKKRLGVLLLVVLLGGFILATTVQAMSSTNYALEWFTPFSSSAGREVTSTHYTLNLTLGQSVIGEGSSPNYDVGLGFWGGGIIETIRYWFDLYLPLTLREAP